LQSRRRCTRRRRRRMTCPRAKSIAGGHWHQMRRAAAGQRKSRVMRWTAATARGGQGAKRHPHLQLHFGAQHAEQGDAGEDHWRTLVAQIRVEAEAVANWQSVTQFSWLKEGFVAKARSRGGGEGRGRGRGGEGGGTGSRCGGQREEMMTRQPSGNGAGG
jgi:hypothetical protein